MIREEVSKLKFYDGKQYIGYISESAIGGWYAFSAVVPLGELFFDESCLGEYPTKDLAKEAVTFKYELSKTPQYTYCDLGLLCDRNWVINGGYSLNDRKVSPSTKNRVILWKSDKLPPNCRNYNDQIQAIEKLLKK